MNQRYLPSELYTLTLCTYFIAILFYTSTTGNKFMHIWNYIFISVTICGFCTISHHVYSVTYQRTGPNSTYEKRKKKEEKAFDCAHIRLLGWS